MLTFYGQRIPTCLLHPHQPCLLAQASDAQYNVINLCYRISTSSNGWPFILFPDESIKPEED